MSTSIQYFGEICIKRFMELEENLYKNPSGFTDYIAGIQETVNNLGIKVIEETLEAMDEMICKSPKKILKSAACAVFLLNRKLSP